MASAQVETPAEKSKCHRDLISHSLHQLCFQALAYPWFLETRKCEVLGQGDGTWCSVSQFYT